MLDHRREDRLRYVLRRQAEGLSSRGPDFPHGVLMRGRRRDPLRLGSFDVNSVSMVQNLVKVKIRGGDIADW